MSIGIIRRLVLKLAGRDVSFPKQIDRKKSAIIYGMNYSPELAGIGKYTGEIAAELVAEDVDVTVISTPPHYPGWKVQEGFRNKYSYREEGGVRVIRTPLLLREKMGGIWRLLAPLSFALTSAPVIFWEIVRRRPECVLCVEPTLFAAPVALFAARLIGARTILHVQDLEVDAAFAVGHIGASKILEKLAFGFERLTLRNFDLVITISNRMADRLKSKGIPAPQVEVVRNWVDLAHIFPLTEKSSYRTEFGFDDDDFVILYSGNIGAKQGLHVLLDAAVELSVQNDIHFVIAGEGPIKKNLKEKYAHLENVRFVPFQPYARFNEFMNMPDLHVLPQDRGAADLVLPSKLGGMLASGRPLIITADEGTEMAEFVQGAAEIVEPGNPTVLSGAILKVKRNPPSSVARLHARNSAEILSKSVGLGYFKRLLFPALR